MIKIRLDHYGPTLEDVAHDFYKKNHLPKPKRIVNTGGSIVLDFGKRGLVSLSGSCRQEGTLREPSLCVGSNKRNATTTRKYYLRGELNKKKVGLEAEVIISTDFVPEYDRCGQIKLRQQQNKIHFERRDDKREYWFLTPAKKKSG